jgi:hypothetical protein
VNGGLPLDGADQDKTTDVGVTLDVVKAVAGPGATPSGGVRTVNMLETEVPMQQTLRG